MTEVLLTAFITGLLGATHCVAMCGGIACILGSQLQNFSPAKRALANLGFNLGRVLSYAIAGALVAGSVQILASLGKSASFLQGLQWLAAILLVLLGLHLTRWYAALGPLEKAGASLWRKLQPTASRLINIKSPLQALPLGLVWGWLPCGLVYSVLSLSAAQASWLSGSLVMLSFGLGTFCVMLAAVFFGQQLTAKLQNRVLQQLTGMFVMTMGVVQLVKLL